VATLSDGLNIESMPTAVTATILGSQCGSLVELDIWAPDVGMAGPNIAALAALTRLTRLDVRTTCHYTHAGITADVFICLLLHTNLVET